MAMIVEYYTDSKYKAGQIIDHLNRIGLKPTKNAHSIEEHLGFNKVFNIMIFNGDLKGEYGLVIVDNTGNVRNTVNAYDILDTDTKYELYDFMDNIAEDDEDGMPKEEEEMVEDSMELVVFTNNGQTFLFKNVTDFTTTTTGFRFIYTGASTGVRRTGVFNNTSTAGYAIS